MKYFYLYARHDGTTGFEVYNAELHVWVPFTGGGTPGPTGATGPKGDPGNNTKSDYGVTGAIDSSNTSFKVIDHYLPTSLEVYVNGLRQFWGTDYAENIDKQTFTLTSAPDPGDKIIASYILDTP